MNRIVLRLNCSIHGTGKYELTYIKIIKLSNVRIYIYRGLCNNDQSSQPFKLLNQILLQRRHYIGSVLLKQYGWARGEKVPSSAKI